MCSEQSGAMWLVCAVCGVAALLAPACTNDEAGDDGGDAGSSQAGSGGAGSGGNAGSTGGGDLSELHGNVTLRYVPEEPATATSVAVAAHTSLLAKLKDGDVPEAFGWTETNRVGDCVLYEPKDIFCDPACGGTAVCVSDDECVALPAPRTVGSVHLTGLGDAVIDVEPIANVYQFPPKVTLPYPPCSEGDAITFAADGGDYPSFSLQAPCIAPLELEGNIVVESGKPVSLAWGVPGDATLSRISVKLDISHHGGSRGLILCDTADSGALEIAEPLITRLIDLGFSGAPSVLLERYVDGTATQPENMRLHVVSGMEKIVEIPGLVSCTKETEAMDCPPGQVCQTDLQCK